MAERTFHVVRDPYAALRYNEYRSFISASFLFTMALLIQEITLAYELYTLTRDPLALGLTGLAYALPFIGLSLFGGHVADRKSKRRIILWSVGAITAGSLCLHMLARHGSGGRLPLGILVGMIYAMVFLTGLGRAFQSPAAASLRAFLVPISVYENASTWSSSAFQAGSILGPAIGGILFGWLGFSDTLLVVAGLFAAALVLYSRIGEKKTEKPGSVRALTESITEGVRFVKRTKPILYAISLDLFSVLFGGVVAILPIYAQDILHVGSEGLGILRAAPALGAILTLLLLSHLSPMHRAWRNLLMAVAGFGASILAFALSPWMPLSVAALFFSGAFDSVSIVIRQTLLQISTPDEMRGRVMAVNGIFVSSSNELGAFESGLAARLMGVVPSAAFGGVMTLVIASYVGWKTRELMRTPFDRSG